MYDLKFGARGLWTISSNLIQRSKQSGGNFRIPRDYHWPIHTTPANIARSLFVVQFLYLPFLKTFKNIIYY